MSTFAFLAVTASTTCTKCKQPLPLNGATESVLCDACRTPIATPASFWKDVLGEALDELPSFGESDGRNTTMILGQHGVTVEMEYGRLAARCEGCKTAMPPEQIASLLNSPAGGEVPCSACQRRLRVRPAPAWFAEVGDGVVGLACETTGGAAQRVTDPKDVRFHCYHCGGTLPLDGTARSVPCPFCSAHVTVPDDIWVRIHPVATRERWFVIISGAHAAPGLPADVWDFCDHELTPDGGMVVAFHANDDGDAGHRARLMRIDPKGAKIWEQDGISFSSDAKLGLSPGDGLLVVKDFDDDWMRFVDLQTGQPVGTIRANKDGDGFSIEYASTLAVDWDGTVLVERSWDAGSALRRFARDGSRLPTWPGLAIHAHDGDAPAWTALRHKPERLPRDAKLMFGWDGFVYVYCERLTHVAKLARDGTLIGVLPVPAAEPVVQSVRGFGVARDGTMFALFEHSLRINDSQYAHVARLLPNGAFDVVLGPHSPSTTFIGRNTKSLRVFVDGSLHLGGEINTLRILAPNGTLAWRSRATVRRDDDELAELEKNRRGKRLVADA